MARRQGRRNLVVWCRSAAIPFDVSAVESARLTTCTQGATMRFLGYTLADESIPMPPPTPGLMADMGAFVEEATKAGVLVATGGIAPSAMGAKIALKDGEYSVIDGPFTEAKELVGGWALLECRDLADAVEWSKRFLGVLGEGEVRVRPVF
jgi:hypothetical protein